MNTWDEPLWSPRRLMIGFRVWLWYLVRAPEVAERVGLLTFLKYQRRPDAQCRETGRC
jgi:hypothetical protein